MYELALLPGVRLALCGETDERQAWSEAALKRYTGGSDCVRARPIRQAPFSYKPIFKLVVHGNNRPKVNVGDAALWGRLHLIPYDFVADPPDMFLMEKLAKERSGILRRLQQGHVEWLAIGLQAPLRVIAAKAEYKADVFVDVDTWIDAYCEIDGVSEIPTQELYDSYRDYCLERKEKPRSLIGFGRRLTDLGVGNKRSNKQKIRVGIKLKLDEWDSEITANDNLDNSARKDDSDDIDDGMM